MHKKTFLFLMIATCFLGFMLTPVSAANQPADKELCADMIRHGKEAYMRGKYLDAKNFFRKATIADPQNQKAWKYYDQTVIFALAEKVEKNSKLLLPDVSIRKEGDSFFSPVADGVISKVGETIQNVKEKLNLEDEDSTESATIPLPLEYEEEEEEEEGC